MLLPCIKVNIIIKNVNDTDKLKKSVPPTHQSIRHHSTPLVHIQEFLNPRRRTLQRRTGINYQSETGM